MINIDGKTIEISRGETGSIIFTSPDYQFKAGDVIKLTILNKNGYTTTPLKVITTTLTADATSAIISLSKTDTTIEQESNKPLVFWYEISVNNQVPVGYSKEDGACQFIVDPSKVGD